MELSEITEKMKQLLPTSVSYTHLDVYKRQERDSAQPRLLETILYKDNFNRAYKRVKANKGAPGIDGIDVYKRQQCAHHYNRFVLSVCGAE